MKKDDSLGEPGEEVVEIYPKRNYRKFIFPFLAVLLFAGGYCLGGSCAVANAGLLGDIFTAVNSISKEALSQVFTNTSPTNEKLVATVNLKTAEKETITSTVKTSEVPKPEATIQEKVISSDQKTPESNPSLLLAGEPVKQKVAINDCSFNPDLIPTGEEVVFNEIAWMGSKDSFRHEWIELKNISDSFVNISGWQVTDIEGEVKIIFPDKTVIPNQGFLLLERGDDAIPQIKADFLYTGNLENESDGLEIFNSKCNLNDKVVASPAWPAGVASPKYLTAERDLDLSWHNYSGLGDNGIFGTPRRENSRVSVTPVPKSDLAANQVASSTQNNSDAIFSATSSAIQDNNQIDLSGDGVFRRAEQTPNSEPPAPTTPVINHLLISEILYDAQGADAGKEFVELYNPTASDIDLKDWSLKNATTSLAKFGSVSLDKLIIKTQGYFLVGLSSYNGSPAADVVRSASLPNTTANILLYDSSGTLVESVSYNDSVSGGQSYERDSWSLTSFHPETNPSPQNSGL